MGIIIFTVIVLLKFFTLIDVSWTIAMLIGLSSIALDFAMPANSAHIDYVKRLETRIDELENEIADLEKKVDDYKYDEID
ncbi:hypothetical protein [Sulfurimonas sp. HSL-1716]|uniref:hypothetical protein n=1 Tax=Hydrocurvibacter sulfurireducens TaxID=3131937 RepID=UPI0031F85D4D